MMHTTTSTSTGRGLGRLALYTAQGMASFAANLLFVGIYFYTQRRFNFTLLQNFALATAQGIVYVGGSLLADPLSARAGRRRLLMWLYAVLALVVVPPMFRPTALCVSIVVLAYSFVISITWPLIESLVAGRAASMEMSRRIGYFNLVWSGTGAVAIAINGTLIAHIPLAVFLIPCVVHALGVYLFGLCPDEHAEPARGEAHVHPEARLLHQRRLALWLSRISMPATYVVIYALAAMLPLLPAIAKLPTTIATVVCSTWLVSRFIAFFILGAGDWWHTRPRLLLWMAMLMAVAFIGITVPGLSTDLHRAIPLMIAAQVLLGITLGVIYTASLYFGMVLSEGSTEHGGYHEALIGLGQALGPGVGALAQIFRPGDPVAGILAVSLVLLATIASAGFIAMKRQ